MSGTPKLSVCICTHNRPRYLADCLDSLQSQTAPPELFELLVVDSASAPEPAATVAHRSAAVPNSRLLRVDQPGLSLARNAGARAARAEYICYIDDDALAAPDLVTTVLEAVSATRPSPALIGGRVLPDWEAPLPAWWPPSLRGILSIVETEGTSEYRSAALPAGLEPCGAIFVVHVPTLLAAGGFDPESGRAGSSLLSDEEVQLAWRLQAAGYSARYDSRLTVHHRIQSSRLTPAWLLSRLYWQGVSAVRTRRLLGHPGAVWRELPRRLAVGVLFAPFALLPRSRVWLIGARWRLAYASGFIRSAACWRTNGTARRLRPLTHVVAGPSPRACPEDCSGHPVPVWKFSSNRRSMAR
jgi:glucosyl-dolichyl phosphate glucuronosyltransferase